MKFAMPRLSVPRHWVVPDWQAEFTAARLLMLSAGLLACIGVVMVASASMGVADATFGHPFYFFARHLVYVLLGVASAIVVVNVPLHVWQRFSWHILAFSFVLLVLVLIPHVGKRINGSARWLGLGPFTIQPSEIGKFAVVLFMAGYLVRRQDEVRTTYVRGFLRAMTKGIRDVLADPDGSIRYVKERDALIDEALEKRRMRLAIDSAIATPIAKADGIGGVQPARLADMVTQVSAAFDLKNPVKPEQVWNGAFLPPKADRMVVPK